MKAGLTGNYGMGKSAVLSMFESLGATVIDSDRVVDRLLKRPDVLAQVRKALGDSVFDGEGRLDKKKTADVVFDDSGKRLLLEGILHPLVFEEVERIAGGSRGPVIVEAALIFEGGYEGRFDKTITVYTDEETAIKRLQSAGVAREDAIKRLSSQMRIEEKIGRSDYSIDNGGNPEETLKQVRRIYGELLK